MNFTWQQFQISQTKCRSKLQHGFKVTALGNKLTKIVFRVQKFVFRISDWRPQSTLKIYHDLFVVNNHPKPPLSLHTI
jgi:hypothetical protein